MSRRWILVGIALASLMVALGVRQFGDTAASDTEDLQLVSAVIDGDTLDVGDTRVRVIGIDTPERGDCYFREATDRLQELVGGEYVRLEADPSQDDTDRWGRVLAHVFVGDVNVAETMIREGYGGAYIYDPDHPHKYQDGFVAAEDEAYRDENGLWGVCS